MITIIVNKEMKIIMRINDAFLRKKLGKKIKIGNIK